MPIFRKETFEVFLQLVKEKGMFIAALSFLFGA